MIDNFNKIGGLLSFNSDDEFYFIQILQRKIDNPGNIHGSNNSSRLIKAYYIDSFEKFNRQKDEMIQLATLFNARIGINLNKRSYYKTAFNTLQTIANQLHNKEFKYIHRAWNTSCGVHNSIEDKIWILDVDDIGRKSNDILRYIEQDCQPIGSKFIDIIPSKPGYHILTKGFDLSKFKDAYPDIEIHKNNPTNLYIP